MQKVDKPYTVYMHIAPNNKRYIGITSQRLNGRFGTNGYGYKCNVYFWRAIQKYGWDNFEHYIYKDNLSQSQANQLEKELIQKYHTQNQEFGYNVAAGGNNIISSENIRQNNIKNWNNGVYNKIKNKVFCVELDRYFESALEAQRQIKVDNSAIQKACKKQVRYAGVINGVPLHWLFAEQVSDNKIKELKNRIEKITKTGVPLYCKELNEYFKSAAEASKKYNIDASAIRKAARGINKSAGRHPVTNEKLHWEQL